MLRVWPAILHALDSTSKPNKPKLQVGKKPHMGHLTDENIEAPKDLRQTATLPILFSLCSFSVDTQQPDFQPFAMRLLQQTCFLVTAWKDFCPALILCNFLAKFDPPLGSKSWVL